MHHADQMAYIERMHAMARANARDEGEVSHTSVEEYFDPDRFEREKAVLFRKYPVVVAFSAQLRKPGDFVANNDSGQPQNDSGPQEEDCFKNPKTHYEIINACTTATKIDKKVNLPLLLSDGGRPPIPP